MKSVIIERPTDWEFARIVPLADLHIGDPHADIEKIERRIKSISEDERTLVVLNGDLMNTATKTSVSDVYDETMKPSRQLDFCSALLEPIKEKIIGATCGNHEHRIYKNDGVDMMRLLCRELDRESFYSPDGILIFLSFGSGSHHGGRNDSKVCYTIYATHGAGGGRKEGGKINRLADLAEIVDADLYIHSHSHLPAAFKENYFRVDVQNKSVREVTKCFFNTAAALSYGGYGQANAYKPATVEFGSVLLSGTNPKAMTAVV